MTSTVQRTVPLRNVFLHLTRACNLRCAYCYLSAGPAGGGELSTAALGRLWPQVVAVRPRKIVFTGGEPLLRPDLCTLLEDLKLADPEHRVLRCLNTNGSLVTRDVARALVPLVDEVRVSVDALRDRNNRLRGEGSFEAAIRALEILCSAGFDPIAMVTLTRPGLADLDDLLAFLLARRITRIHLNTFRAVGRGAGRVDWKVTPDEAGAALDRAWHRIFPGRPSSRRPEAECVNCGIGSFVNILPEGDVYPCHVLVASGFRLGNVLEQSLVELCAACGPFGRLQSMDFRKLADSDPGWKPLVIPGSCLGDHWRRQASSGWRGLETPHRLE